MAYEAYSQIVQMGVNAGAKLITGDQETFNNEYNREMKKLSLMEQEAAAISRIRAANQDKILTNNQIELNREQTEANIKVMAAAYGAVGSGVDSQYQANEKAAANSEYYNELATQAKIEQEKAVVNQARSGRLSMKENKPSFLKEFAGNMGQIDWWEKNEKSGQKLYQSLYSDMKVKF